MITHPIIIIGAGPAGLMAAQTLAEAGHRVDIYDHHKAPARKFLVAGHGGFNITHSEPMSSFIYKYNRSELHPILQHFTNEDTRSWLRYLGIETYIGSSGKVFPNAEIKPIQVLQSWLDHLSNIGVKINLNHKCIDFNNDSVIFDYQGNTIKKGFSHLIFSVGGGSWSKTGSDGHWMSLFNKKNIITQPFSAANSGYETADSWVELEGHRLKNIEVFCNNVKRKGEIVFTKYGIEGSPIYYLNRYTRDLTFPFDILIDLKPAMGIDKIISILEKNKNTTKQLKDKLNLSKTSITLLKSLPKEIYTNHNLLAYHIKNWAIRVTSLRPVEEVISTAGGVDFSEIHSDLSLVKYPKVYCIGEMLDWEAPTGGYLLQACFSMGRWVGDKILGK